MIDFALICRTYGEQTNWYFVPRVSNVNVSGVTVELEAGELEDGTRYTVQAERMESLFLPANLDILAALRKLIHDVPPSRIASLDEAGRLSVNYMPTGLSFTETPPIDESERCNNPECCPPLTREEDAPAIAGHGRNITWDEAEDGRDARIRNLCREDAILLGLCIEGQAWPPPIEETE